MFEGNKKAGSSKPCETIDTLIGLKTEVNGDIVFSGGLRIDGTVNGNITADGESNSTLVLSEHAKVNGNINAPHMIVNGAIEGNVISHERIELQPKAEVHGDIQYRVIEMALGATINGKLVRETGPESGRKGGTATLKSISTGSNPMGIESSGS